MKKDFIRRKLTEYYRQAGMSDVESLVKADMSLIQRQGRVNEWYEIVKKWVEIS